MKKKKKSNIIEVFARGPRLPGFSSQIESFTYSVRIIYIFVSINCYPADDDNEEFTKLM